jgi:serine/threonine-protein kinase HipA
MLSQSARFLLAKDEAVAIIEEMKTNLRANWYTTSRGQGVSERDCERISGAFAYEGFDLPLP